MLRPLLEWMDLALAVTYFAVEILLGIAAHVKRIQLAYSVISVFMPLTMKVTRFSFIALPLVVAATAAMWKRGVQKVVAHLTDLETQVVTVLVRP